MSIDVKDRSNEVLSDAINQGTEDSLIDLKKQVAEEVVDKILKKNPNAISLLFKKTAEDFIVDEGTLEDYASDLFLGGIGNSLDLMSPALNRYREMMSEAKTKNELESLKTRIFNEIDGVDQQSSQDNIIQDTTTQESVAQGFTTSDGNSGKAKVDTSSESYEKDHLDIVVSEEAKNLYEGLKGNEKPDLEPFACALKVYNSVKSQGKLHNTKYMTVVDFTKSKSKHRFFVINMETNTVENAVNVGHGKRTGGDWAKEFSNRVGSNKTSLGGYLLPDKITKSPNKSWSGLRQITGLESSNSNAATRGIAVHPGGANLGSEGCFTLPRDISRKIMDKIKGTFLFAYAKDSKYFAQSQYFTSKSDGTVMA